MSALALYDAMVTADKVEWVKRARIAFDPGERRDCKICARFASIAHAHHIIPLAMQFDRGFIAPMHNFVWLCPNHHSAIHLVITQISGLRVNVSQDVLSLIGELIADHDLDDVLKIAQSAFAEYDARILRKKAEGFLLHADALEAEAQDDVESVAA